MRPGIAVLVAVVTAVGSSLGPTAASRGDDALARFDQQVEALRGAGEAVEPSRLKTWPTLVDDRNAVRIITDVVDQLRRSDLSHDRRVFRLTKRPADLCLPLSPEDRVQLRAELDRVGSLVQSLDRIDQTKGFDWGGAPSSPLAKWRTGRSFATDALTAAHLLRLDALGALDAGDCSRAVRRAGQMRRIADGASLLPSRSGFTAAGMIDSLAADVLAQTCATDACARLTHGQRATIEETIKMLLDEAAPRQRLRRWLAGERLVTVDTVRAFANGQLAARDIEATDHEAGVFSGATGYFRTHPDVLLEVFNREIGVLDSSRAINRSGVVGARDQSLQHVAEQSFAAMRITSQFMAPRLADAWQLTFDVLGERRLAAVSLAIGLYCADHGGAWPATLDDLVPRYFPDVPDDPTSLEPAKVKYRVNGGEPLLWACGENGRDDGATPAEPGMDPRERYEKTDRVVRLRLATAR